MCGAPALEAPPWTPLCANYVVVQVWRGTRHRRDRHPGEDHRELAEGPRPVKRRSVWRTTLALTDLALAVAIAALAVGIVAIPVAIFLYIVPEWIESRREVTGAVLQIGPVNVESNVHGDGKIRSTFNFGPRNMVGWSVSLPIGADTIPGPSPSPVRSIVTARFRSSALGNISKRSTGERILRVD